MDKIISKNMPTWLIAIIKKIKYEKFNILQISAINMYLQSMPQLNNSYDIQVTSSSAPQVFLDKFNNIDFQRIDAKKKADMQKFITDYVKNNGLI
jgi:hypothetical protein